MKTKVLVACLSAQLIGTAGASAQTASELAVDVSVYKLRTDGADVHAGGSFIATWSRDRERSGARFSTRGCGHFSIEAGAEGPFQKDATTGWRVEIGPIQVATGSVTFRVRWLRELDTKGLRPKSAELELTMRPGESRQLDTADIAAGAATIDGRPCDLSATSLRVSVDYYPNPQFERRLMATDLWLIERLPNGTERVQSQALRSLPHRETPFFFDTITEGNLSLEVVGQVIARPYGSAIEASLSTRPRWGPTVFDWRHGESQMRYVDSRLELKPGETVEVALPKLESSAGPFADRKYAIRIRVRQLR
jgi:hypothetical protein